MATFTFEAVFSEGVLRPLAKIDGLTENQRVAVTVTPAAEPSRSKPLAGWKGGMSDEDAKEMMRIISDEFGYRDESAG